MKLNSWIAFIGALFAAGCIIALYFRFDISLASLFVVVGAAIISYVIAAIAGAFTKSNTSFEEFMRGWLVGMNASLNGLLLISLFELSGNMFVGILAGKLISVFILISVFQPISQSEIYQGFLGWFNWFMPMSWLVVALGFIFCFVSFLGHAFTLGKVNYLKIQSAAADWKTGTFFIKGGLISNLNPIDTAFNMGNFSFVDYKSGAWHIAHEAGHTLNLAAFGSLFHLLGAFEENVINGANAYSERIAESNNSGASGSNIPMWA